VSPVSVVIPAQDAERHLREAIDSALGQTFAPLEILVVDDGSTDRTADVASSYGPPVRCVRLEHAGVATALNRGVDEAQGELLAFLDADDVWTPGKLALQVAALAAEPELDLVLGDVEYFHSPELTDDERATLPLPQGPVAGLSKGTMLIRRAAFLRVGPFATEWTTGEFVDWWARAVDGGLRSARLDAVVMHRRLHASNSGIRDRDARLDYVRIVRSALKRRRPDSPGLR
jgi:glycosyltransferase involved in cell wall biosynthesis